MSISQYETQVSPDGYIALPPEYQNRKVVVYVDEKKVDERKDESRTIGSEREPLSDTEEQRRAAGQKFFDTWNGLLEGMPDMTMKEIRAERLERRHGK